jgi:hypothetical protein
VSRESGNGDFHRESSDAVARGRHRESGKLRAVGERTGAGSGVDAPDAFELWWGPSVGNREMSGKAWG